MTPFEKYEDMLPDYLSGRLSEEQEIELERQIESSEDLRQALAETRMIAAGIRLIDRISGQHIDSSTLVSYCDDPNSLEETERRSVEAHLRDCEECRQELVLCRAQPDEGKAPVGLFGMMMEWLFAPRMVLRPIYAVAATGLVLLVAGYIGFGTGERVPARADFRLNPTTRDILSANRLEIEHGTAVARLEFVIPSKPGCSYDLELDDSSGNSVLMMPNRPAKDSHVLEIPTSCLADGRYRLRVVEVSPGVSPVEVSTFDFLVTIVPTK